MTERFELKLQRSGDQDQIDFTAYGPTTAEGGQALQPRQKPPVNLEQIERLRQGDAPLNTVAQLSQLVSAWLLNADLNPWLQAAVDSLDEDERLRVIFHIDKRLREDAELGDLLADLPFELLTLHGDIVPLVLSPRIAAFIHRLNKVPSARVGPMPPTAQLRVLIVHANPGNLGGKVPSPAPLRDSIQALAAGVGPNLVQVDILSREAGPGVIGLPTSDGLWRALRDGIYHILVFLGHGGREELREDVLPLSLLYLESPTDPAQQIPVRADVLATELHNNPIPVVLLMGCLTAAEVPPGERAGLLGAMPVAMRGNQGMAQALVNSSSGVQVAVGMRYRLDSDDALDFLREFFESLLRTEPGDVDAAVHAGRERLHAANRFPGTYSAPVVYRVVAEEPMFGFLAAPPPVVVKEAFQKSRATFWKMIAAAGSTETIQAAGTALAGLDAELVADMATQAPLLMPVHRIADPNQAVEMPVRLHGTLEVDALEGHLVIDGEGVVITGVVTGKGARNSGYRVLPEIDGSACFFRIQPRHDHDGSPLPEDEIMIVTMEVVGHQTSIVYPVAIEILKVEPHAVICPVSNAVIVPPAFR